MPTFRIISEPVGSYTDISLPIGTIQNGAVMQPTQISIMTVSTTESMLITKSDTVPDVITPRGYFTFALQADADSFYTQLVDLMFYYYRDAPANLSGPMWTNSSI